MWGNIKGVLMIKRTLYFGNPAYLSTRLQQMTIESPDASFSPVTVPVEDIGVVVLDHHRITITQPLLNRLLENNVAVITCDSTHHPLGMFYVLEGNTLQSQKFKYQINASEPLKKQLWQQIVKAKLHNQAVVLEMNGRPAEYLRQLVTAVRSGDTENCEAKGATYYWKYLFPKEFAFKREREGLPPNNLLNYGYAIIRALMARSIVAAGLMPTLGIFHRSQYNAFCLADDMVEPYRPYVDALVCKMVLAGEDVFQLNTEVKKQLLEIINRDVYIRNQTSPLSVAVQRTAYSLAKCFEGGAKKLVLPEIRHADL